MADNTVASREAAIAQVVTLLQGVTSGLPSGVAIPHVFRHEPVFVPEGRTVALVYRGTGEAEGYPFMTLGHMMVALRFDVLVSWPWGNYDAGYLDDIEKEIVDLDRAIVAALSADRDLGGNISALLLGDSETGYMTQSTDAGDVFVGRWLRLPITMQILDAETVSL